MSSFYMAMIGSLQEVGISSKDSIQVVMKKVENSTGVFDKKDVVKVKSFLRSFWDIERNLLDDANPPPHPQEDGSDQTTVDPAIEKSIIIKTPGEKFLKFLDTLFCRCSSCGGRLFPQFKFCPHCSKAVDEGKDLSTLTIPEVPFNNKVRFNPKRLREQIAPSPPPPGECNRRYMVNDPRKEANMEQPNCYSKAEIAKMKAAVVFDDGDIKISQYDLKEAERIAKEIGIASE